MKLTILFFNLLCALWLAPALAAEEAPLGSNLAGLLAWAREHNPELAATRYEAAAAQERAEPAGALPDPVLRAEMMDITNQGTTSPQLLPSQVGGTRYLLMQTFPWFGRRGLQRDVASAQAAQANGQAAASWVELASRIKTTYAMHYYNLVSEQLVQQSLALLDELELIAQTRYANGIGSQQEVIRVQVERTMLRSELIMLQNEGHHSTARLNALLARPVNAPLADSAALRELPPPAQLDEQMLLGRLRARNPQLQMAEANFQAAEKSRDLAYSNRYPGFTVGVAPTQSGTEIRSWDLMLEFSIPLQQSSRRSQEREAEAMLAASDARKTALLNQMEADLSEKLSTLEASRRSEQLISTRLLPQAELTYQSALAGYETGKVDFATLIDAQKQILNARQQQLRVQVDMQLQLAEVEKLLGDE